MGTWHAGQRCVSLGEPALGLGIIKEVDSRTVVVTYHAANCERTYPLKRSPLKRVRFEPGEKVTSREGHSFLVSRVEEQNHILFYLGETELLPETELHDAHVYSRPDQKLLAGHLNKPIEFSIRHQSWEMKNLTLSNEVRGMVGARIQLLPHQLYISDEVSKRFNPRVLLSDEVGLGKTIEAGLIFHRMWTSLEARRVLILCPGSLISQWLTEMYRKFNCLFTLVNQNWIEDCETTYPGMNPYHCRPCMLQDIETLLDKPEQAAACAKGEWDLVIVDEAHRLEWQPQNPSPGYQILENIAAKTQALLLLTATPMQLGLESHFGRLKLLDPQRFDDFEKFQQEVEGYGDLSKIVERLDDPNRDRAALQKDLEALFPEEDFFDHLEPDESLSLVAREKIIESLIDRHGTGRVMFRNRRHVLPGSPERILNPVALTAPPIYRQFIEATRPHLASLDDAADLIAGPPAFFNHERSLKKGGDIFRKAWVADPRLDWLIKLLRKHPESKFLLICARKTVALALQERLGLARGIELATFHEDLSLLERDRQAAYFAKEGGAQLLVCSEIGSEGRNFQFAHHLVLWDLPLNPGLLEQRIGRLDRIGQSQNIHIHIPYIQDSPHQQLYRWYQEGLNAFAEHLMGGEFLYEELNEQLLAIFEGGDSNFEPFLEASRNIYDDMRTKIEAGRDKLLEKHSFRSARGEMLKEKIEDVDDGLQLQSFMDGLFELFNLDVAQLDESTQLVAPSTHMFVESFPCLPEEGLQVTYERQAAVAREELAFLTIDHPMVTGAIDLMLQTERGTTSFCIWNDAPTPGMLVQCLFVLEATGTDDDHLNRYLPPTPILISVDQAKKVRNDLADAIVPEKLEKGPINKLLQMQKALEDILAVLIPSAETEAQKSSQRLLRRARQRAKEQLQTEIERLEQLAQINPGVRPDEIETAQKRLDSVIAHLKDTNLRMEAIRLVLMVPKKK